jgi:hypothetical protein
MEIDGPIAGAARRPHAHHTAARPLRRARPVRPLIACKVSTPSNLDG